MELFACKYGVSQFPSRTTFKDDTLHRDIPFSWMFYLIKYGDKNILVDTGFHDERQIKHYSITAYKDPVSLLAELHVPEHTVTDIILTHAHFDHMGCAHRFPGAAIYIQKDELQCILNDADFDEKQHAFFMTENIISFDDTVSLYGVFTVRNIGGHSIGSSVVSFTKNGRKIMLTGDECYINDNYLLKKGVAAYYDAAKNQAFVETVTADYDMILTFHEPSVVGEGLSFRRILP